MRFSSIVLASLTVFAAASLAAQVPASHALAARGKSSDDNGESTYGDQGDKYSPDSGDSTYGSDSVDCPEEPKQKFPKNRLRKTWGGHKTKSMKETDSYGTDDDDKKLPKHKEEASTYGEDTDKWSSGDGGDKEWPKHEEETSPYDDGDDDGDDKKWPKHKDETSTYGEDTDWSEGDGDSDHGSKGKKWSPDSYNKDGDDLSYGDDDEGHWSGGDGRSSGKSKSGGEDGWSKGDGWNNGNLPGKKIPLPKNDFCPECGDGWDQPCQYDDDGVYQEGGAMNKCPDKVVKHYNNGDNQCYSGSMGGSGPLIGAMIGNCIDACILSNDCPDQPRNCQTPNNLIGQIINIEALNCLTLRALTSS